MSDRNVHSAKTFEKQFKDNVLIGKITNCRILHRKKSNGSDFQCKKNLLDFVQKQATTCQILKRSFFQCHLP